MMTQTITNFFADEATSVAGSYSWQASSLQRVLMKITNSMILTFHEDKSWSPRSARSVNARFSSSVRVNSRWVVITCTAPTTIIIIINRFV